MGGRQIPSSSHGVRLVPWASYSHLKVKGVPNPQAASSEGRYGRRQESARPFLRGCP